MLDTPTSRLVSETSARLRGAWVDKWFTAHTVHSSQFTVHTSSSRASFRSSTSNLANVAPAGTSRRRRPRLLLVGATQGPPLQSMVQQQDVLSCLSAERTSEYYSNGCARVWHLPRSTAAADGAISRALLSCLLGRANLSTICGNPLPLRLPRGTDSGCATRRRFPLFASGGVVAYEIGRTQPRTHR